MKAWITLWRSQLALQLVCMVYTKLFHTNKGLGGLLETPNTPLNNVQIQGNAIEKKISTQLFYYNKFNKAIKVFKFVFNACLFSQVFHSKFGEALVASNPMVLLGWLTSKTQKYSFKQRINFLFQSLL